jgi:hypothetical protein
VIPFRVTLAVAAILVIAAVVLVAWSLRRRAARGPIARPLLCPGQRLSWLRSLSPLRLIHTPLCGYDLAGLSPGPDGSVVCPECARHVRSINQARRDPRRLHLGRAGLLVLAGFLALWFSPLVRTGAWVRFAPDAVILAAKQWLGGYNPPLFERALAARVSDGSLATWVRPWAARLIASDLRDDEIKWNAARAVGLLRDLRLDGYRALHAALDSEDHQQRHLAARSLRYWPGMGASDRVVAVTVEGLREASGFVSECFDWLGEHPEGATTHLAAGLNSDDAQQRFLCAALIGLNREDALFDRAAPMLLEALKDNGVEEDAKIAARALAGFSPEAVIPALEAIADAPDLQQRTLARQVLEAIGAPAPMVTRVDARPVRTTSVRMNPATLDRDQLLMPWPVTRPPAPADPAASAMAGK